ncbi:Helix-destabilizing protein [Limihaloglobus sulfuriphilus]|uniref:Single-stranded DNA-binding protein n=1 Tax=Limihaloglobus sulfuriphilus TaxID=1851148 RepID=A0A1Q2MCR8_9BACT|nr:single-stranded DNA-binding protein [Limihaloglobus sulfuriphilus]AQQ70097.1 Helix-destabilizing protein [Limihaloglobus sulfuriphilus]
MANLNKVFLMGNLTRDPQYSVTPSQVPVVEFGLAVNRKYRGQNGQMQEDTCFVDCTAFAGRADTLNKYMRKGSPIFIEGRLHYSSWNAQDGSKRSRLRVVIDNFQFLGGGGGGGQGGQSYGSQPQGGYGGGHPEAQSGQSGSQGYNQPSPMDSPDQPPAYGELDDDIPF